MPIKLKSTCVNNVIILLALRDHPIIWEWLLHNRNYGVSLGQQQFGGNSSYKKNWKFWSYEQNECRHENFSNGNEIVNAVIDFKKGSILMLYNFDIFKYSFEFFYSYK